MISSPDLGGRGSISAVKIGQQPHHARMGGSDSIAGQRERLSVGGPSHGVGTVMAEFLKEKDSSSTVREITLVHGGGGENPKAPLSYSAAVKGDRGVDGIFLNPFEGLKAPPRPTMKVDGLRSLVLSEREIQAAAERLRYTMVLKFSAGRPQLKVIHDHINQGWGLKAKFNIGLLDPRHVLVYLTNEEDFTRALSKDSNVIANSNYRSFRWTPDFDFTVDNPCVATWVHLPNLPLYWYAYLENIGNMFGRFLRADDRTLGFTHHGFARLCVEVDLFKTSISPLGKVTS